MTAIDVTLPSLPNLRDLGGFATSDGGRTRAGVVLRSEAPALADPADAVALADRFGVADVIDLRRPDETLHRPLPEQLAARARLHPVPFDIEAPPHITDAQLSGAQVTPRHVGGFYAWMAERNIPALREVFDRIADSEGAVLIHCAVGKDRTGITAALALLGASVAEDAIVAEYARSHTAMRQTLPRHDPELTAELIDADIRLGAPEAVMIAFLAALADQHGAPTGFWDSLDPDAELRQRLRARWVAPADE